MIFTTPQLARLATRFRKHRPISIWALSIAIVGEKNPKLVQRLLDGKGITLNNGEKASRWFIEHWPDDLPWPSDIPNPSINKALPISDSPANGPKRQSSVST